MQKISALIITKNEEEMIADCIRSVSFCDEIIVIDTASTDRTREIATRLGATVYEYVADDFAKRRNYAKQKATGDWLFYIDADERVSKELAVHIKMILAHPSTVSAYVVRRRNYYFHTFQWPKIEQLERLFRADSLMRWSGRLHETAVIKGEIGVLNGFLLHFTHRDLSGMLTKTLSWSTIEAQLRHEAGHPRMSWWRFFRVMLTAFCSSYIAQRGYTVGTAGLIESIYQGYSAFVTYAKLWELQQSKQEHYA
ncbi:MAG: hypothetical protein RLZZ455_479 [Candidatus Parcubacteria bacterium]|jgi:hypothetical protein